MIKIGILGGAGYTAGELIRLLLHHPEAELTFVNSESNAGNLLTDVHEGLYGDTDLRFTSEMPFGDVDVVFFCFGQDFRLAAPGGYDSSKPYAPDNHDFVYGLPEINRERIASARHIANPGCFATCIQLGLLPAARMKLVRSDVMVNAITGSTGAGVKPGATTHFSWRTDNLSVYKAFRHQHVPEIRQSLRQVQGSLEAAIDFIPYRGNFARGIFATEVLHTDAAPEYIVAGYKEFYALEPFTHYVDKPLDMKQVVNTNKALVHCDVIDGKLLVTTCIDNLLKGAVGQAVQNMNIMFGIGETAGLGLKPSAF